MLPPTGLKDRTVAWSKKGFARVALVVVAAGLIASIASAFGIVRDFGFLRASLLSGAPGGQYHALATRLSARAQRERGTLSVVTTAGSVENLTRLANRRGSCSETFAFAQDGTPIPAGAGLEVLGRLPEPESLFLLTRKDRAWSTFQDLEGASIGIGPEGSGTAYLVRELFADPDLQSLKVRLSPHDVDEQLDLVAKGALDVAAYVVNVDAERIRKAIRTYDLEILSPRDIDGLVARHRWLGLGRIPAGRYDLVRPSPPTDKAVAQVDTLVFASACAGRAERVAFLMLLSAELPDFVRRNPPHFSSSSTNAPLAREARQFFASGEPEFADRYFPWLVDILSPSYWIYLAMAVTVLFNAMNGFSKFRLWRLDSAREKFEAQLQALTGSGLTRDQMRALPPEDALVQPGAQAAAETLLRKLAELRLKCQRQTSSIFTPMGEEMFYRYQESLIDDVATTVGALLQKAALRA